MKTLTFSGTIEVDDSCGLGEAILRAAVRMKQSCERVRNGDQAARDEMQDFHLSVAFERAGPLESA